MNKRIVNKRHRGKLPCNILSKHRLGFLGEYVFVSTSFGLLPQRQIETGRNLLYKQVTKDGKVFVRIFCNKPATKKSLESRMGKGKGPVEYWTYPLKAGEILYEIIGLNMKSLKPLQKMLNSKLSVKGVLKKLDK